jgi:hypothetical protein
VCANAEAGPDLVDPVPQHRDDPVHLRHRQHRAQFRCPTARCLAPPDEQRTNLAVLGGAGIVPQIGQVHADHLSPPQPVRVHGLDQGGIA